MIFTYNAPDWAEKVCLASDENLDEVLKNACTQALKVRRRQVEQSFTENPGYAAHLPADVAADAVIAAKLAAKGK